MSQDRTPDLAELPIACTLDAGAAADRLGRWEALSERAGRTVRREADRIVAAYPAGTAAREELDALVAAERRCCAFARWEIVSDDGHLLLNIIATARGLDAITSLIAAQ